MLCVWIVFSSILGNLAFVRKEKYSIYSYGLVYSFIVFIGIEMFGELFNKRHFGHVFNLLLHNDLLKFLFGKYNFIKNS